MDPLDFFPYHNRLITFKQKGKQGLRRGVVIDKMDYSPTKKSTYIFIDFSRLKEWKIAEAAGNKNKMQEIEEPINISEIEKATSGVDLAINQALSSALSQHIIPKSLQNVLEIIKDSEGHFKIVKKR